MSQCVTACLVPGRGGEWSTVMDEIFCSQDEDGYLWRKKNFGKKKLLNCISGEVCGGDPVLPPYSEKIATSINAILLACVRALIYLKLI